MIHSFDVEVAKRIGVPEAILVSNICYWVKKNQANEKHFYDGYYWTYNSARAFAELFPYWSQDQVKRLIKKLEDIGIIASGNFSEAAYDRTKWYTIIDQSIARLHSIHCAESPNELRDIAQPITDSKPIVNTDSKPLIEISKESLTDLRVMLHLGLTG